MRVQFAECNRRGRFVALRPDPIGGLQDLVSKTRRRWPDVVPYEGIYEDVEPHLTVALRCSEETAMTIEQEVTAELPISTELRAAWLVAFEGQWRLRGRAVQVRRSLAKLSKLCPTKSVRSSQVLVLAGRIRWA